MIEQALTFDDVLLAPGYSEVLPQDTSLCSHLTEGIPLNIPLLSAAMDTVTESRLAIAMAQEGGIGVMHKSMPAEQQALEVRKVKKFESGVVAEPITVTPETTISELLALRDQFAISGMPVVSGKELVGMITNRDVRFATDLNQPVAKLMTPKSRLVTVKQGCKREQVIALLHQHRIEKLLVVDDDFHLAGMITVKDILKAKEKPNACKDSNGQLRVAAAVGVGEEGKERISLLVEAGVDALVIDTAHGHSKAVIGQLQWAKTNYPSMPVIAGNIATAEAARALADAGADAVKVGIGPGSICTTRIVAGIGVPQISAILAVSQALKKRFVPVIADGGLRYSGDVAKALAAGASTVMIGGLFAGTKEAPGSVELYQGRSYKAYRGMGSVGAMAQRYGSSDRYSQTFDRGDKEKLVPEGIEGRVPYKGSLLAVTHQLMGGLRACMGYTGSACITDLHKKAKFLRVSVAGMRESHVHDVMITKEAPNYQVESS